MPREYARIRVCGRFDVILHRPPSVDRPARIDQLHLPARQRQRKARGLAGTTAQA